MPTKSSTFLVTSVRPYRRAVAAITASEIHLPFLSQLSQALFEVLFVPVYAPVFGRLKKSAFQPLPKLGRYDNSLNPPVLIVYVLNPFHPYTHFKFGLLIFNAFARSETEGRKRKPSSLVREEDDLSGLARAHQLERFLKLVEAVVPVGYDLIELELTALDEA